MPWHHKTPCSAFLGSHLLAQGLLDAVVVECKRSIDSGEVEPLLIFKDEDYTQIEVDFRGTVEDVVVTLPREVSQDVEVAPVAGVRGRPKLGVVAREVTLLPRHWEWLKSQSGGASVALRKLVEAARKASSPQDKIRQEQSSAYRFMAVMAGAQQGFEEASRALFAQDMDAYIQHSDTWPADVRSQARKLAARAISD